MKTKNIFSLVVLAIALAACSSENDMTTFENPLQKGKIVTLTATISADNASTRTLTDNGDGTISAAWEVGAEMEVWYHSTTSENRVKGKATITNVDADGKATITAELTDPKNDTSVDFQYPYGYDGRQLRNDQNGTLNLIDQKFDSQGGGGKLIVNGDKASLPGNVHIEHHNSILKLNFLYGSQDVTSDIRGIDIDVELEGENQQDHYHLGNLSLQGALYLVLEPKMDYSTNPYAIKSTRIHIHAHTADGTTYATTKQHIQLDKGKMYTSSLEMEKELKYMAWNKDANRWETRGVTGYKVLNNLVSDQGGELPGGLYAVTSQLKFNGTLKFTGNTELVLCDNTNISNIAEGSASIDASSYELSIYAQRLENDPDNEISMGGINVECADGTALKAQNLYIHGGFIAPMTKADNFAGITAVNINVYGGVFGSNSYGENNKAIGICFSGDFNIYGGHVSARGGAGGIQYAPENGPSQGSGLTIYNGIVDATCEQAGHGITCHTMTINGGSVTASGASVYQDANDNYTPAGDGINCGASITVNGGNLTAWGGNNNYSGNQLPCGYGIGGGTIYVNGGELHANGGDGGTPAKGINENLIISLRDGIYFYENTINDFDGVSSSNPPCTKQYVVIK